MRLAIAKKKKKDAIQRNSKRLTNERKRKRAKDAEKLKPKDVGDTLKVIHLQIDEKMMQMKTIQMMTQQ